MPEVVAVVYTQFGPLKAFNDIYKAEEYLNKSGEARGYWHVKEHCWQVSEDDRSQFIKLEPVVELI